jgi:hypothetical protein
MELLRQLAQARGDRLKQYLVEEKGIAPDRLLVCSPEVDQAEGATPRVELSL